MTQPCGRSPLERRGLVVLAFIGLDRINCYDLPPLDAVQAVEAAQASRDALEEASEMAEPAIADLRFDGLAADEQIVASKLIAVLLGRALEARHAAARRVANGLRLFLPAAFFVIEADCLPPNLSWRFECIDARNAATAKAEMFRRPVLRTIQCRLESVFDADTWSA